MPSREVSRGKQIFARRRWILIYEATNHLKLDCGFKLRTGHGKLLAIDYSYRRSFTEYSRLNCQIKVFYFNALKSSNPLNYTVLIVFSFSLLPPKPEAVAQLGIHHE